jgi:ISXO2 transposase-like protein
VKLGRGFTGGRFSVDHEKAPFVVGQFNSNTIESFFSIFKRGVIGTYDHLSEAHMHRYLAEFDLRAGTLKMNDADRADEIIKGGAGRRLTYRRIDRHAA